jgi:hypothetical protein
MLETCGNIWENWKSGTKKGRHTWDWEGWNTGNCAITEVDLTGIIIVKEWSTRVEQLV